MTRNTMVPVVLGFLVVCTAVACSGDKRRGVGPKVEEHSQYAVSSAFNVQTDFGDSTVGSKLDLLKNMSDDADDPGRFVMEQVADYLPWPLDSAASPLIDELAPDVNAIIIGTVPATEQIRALAAGLSNVARVFEVQSFLDVGLDSRGRFTAAHLLTSVHFGYQGLSLELTEADFGEVLPTERIAVQLEDGSMVIPRHRLPLPVGTALQRALDRIVVPAVNADATDLADLVGRWFACREVAATIADAIGGPESTVLDACFDGSRSAADKLTEKFAAMDKEAGFYLAGHATFDAVNNTWTGDGWNGVYKLGDGSSADLEPDSCAFDLAPVPAP